MRRHAVRALLGLVGCYLLAVGYQLWALQRDLARARDDIADLSLASIEDAGGIRDAVSPALDAVDRARDRAEGPLLASLTPVPIVGAQVEGIRDLVDRLGRVVDRADGSLDRVEAALDDATEPEDRITLVDTAIAAVDDVVGAIDDLSASDRDGLVGPFRSATVDLDRRLAEGRRDLTVLRDHLTTARRLLVGPTTFLVVASNNAELRAGMGMHLSAGLVTVADGSFETTRFVPTVELTERTIERSPSVPPELARLYGDIWDFGREWRTTSTTPDFPVVGAVLTDLAAQVGLGRVDAVLSLDAPALAPLLTATGPVERYGATIDAGNVVDVLLRDLYLVLGDEEEADQRRQLQSDIAVSIFDAITERDVDVVTLARGMVDAAAGRHLLAWSGDDDLQSLWRSLGADGALDDDSFLVSFQNASASKRDYYLQPSVRIDPLAIEPDGERRFRIQATLPNPVVDPTSEYVDSLNPLVPVGVHRAYVTFTLPRGAHDIDVRRGDRSGIGTDGPTVVAAVWLRVPEGESRTATVDVTLPAGVDRVRLLPSARVHPQSYAFGPVVVSDRTERSVALPYVSRLRAQEPKPVEAGALVILFAGLALVVSRARRLAGPEPDLDAARVDGQLARALVLLALTLLVFAGLS